MLGLMRASGCVQLNLAIESGCQEVLDGVMHKPVKLEEVEGIIAKAREIGLPLSTFFVVGMPGETIGQMEETFRYASRHGFYSPFVSVATPYPGSRLREICVENGFLDPDQGVEDLQVRSFSIRTPEWGAEDVREVINWGMGHLYRAHARADFRFLLRDLLGALFRPWYLLMRLCDLISPRIRARMKRWFGIERTA
jgi:magnesium-protoporphyrin IX monomethyl ester (oxidative) cyclase